VFGFLLGAGNQEKIVCRVYGDNLLVIVPRLGTEHWGIDEISEVWMSIFGQRINPDESYEARHLIHRVNDQHHDSVSFLSRHLMEGGAVWRPASDTISSMICPEGGSNDDRTRYARACGLMVDNPFNPEATLFLEDVLNKLESQGVFGGELGHREKFKFKHKLTEIFEGNSMSTWSSRMTVAENQLLYLYTKEERGQLGLNPHQTLAMLDQWAEREFLRRDWY
jgi:hypothetical protein